MCLSIYTNKPTLSTPQTAKQDIEVVKIFVENNKSPYQNFQYIPWTLYRLRKSLEISRRKCLNGLRDKKYRDVVHEGFHSILVDEIDDNHKKTGELNLPGNERLTSFIKRFCYARKCIIPRGAKFLIGDNGDIVSTSLRTCDLKKSAF